MDYASANSAIAALAPSMIAEFKPFLSAAKIAAHVAERRNTIPVLSNVRLTGTGESLRVTGTDLDLECSIEIPAAADQRFDTTVPAYLLADITRKTKRADMVSIDLDAAANLARIDFGGPRHSLQTIPAADFPVFKRPDAWTAQFTMPTHRLVESLARVEFAVSTDETRYYLNGVYMHRTGADELVFVATDGHRLCKVAIPAPDGTDGMPGVIIPAKTVREFLRVAKAKDAPASVVVRVATSAVEFAFGAVTMTSKTVDGTFPDYDRVTPLGNDKRLVVNTKEFGDLVTVVGALHSERGRAIKLVICQEGMTGSVDNPDAGSARGDLVFDEEADGFAEPMEIGFNARYLLDFCALGSERLEFRFAEPVSPVLILDPADRSWTGVMMPMRV